MVWRQSGGRQYILNLSSLISFLFQQDVQCSALVLNFNNIFSNEHLYRAGQSMNSLSSQILERWQQLQTLYNYDNFQDYKYYITYFFDSILFLSFASQN